jgi:hypothetical protein
VAFKLGSLLLDEEQLGTTTRRRPIGKEKMALRANSQAVFCAANLVSGQNF